MATIPFADVLDWQPLPIDAQDVVTKVRLVVAGNLAGASPSTLRAVDPAERPARVNVNYVAVPIVVVYEAPEHAIYGTERSFALPAGVNPFLPPTDPGVPEPSTVLNFTNPGSPSVIRDGDPETYAEAVLGVSPYCQIIYWPVPDAVGFRLRYELYDDAPTRASVRFALEDPNNYFHAEMYIQPVPPIPTPDSGPNEIYGVMPASAQAAKVNQPPFVGIIDDSGGYRANLRLLVFPEAESCTVTDFYPLVLNRPLLLDIARQQVRLPAMLPQRVTVRGVIPPDAEHTITGWPGGDYTGAVAQVQYDLGRTVIDFEQASAPVGLPAEAMEAARERRNATDAAVQTANYNLKMGIRG